MSTMCLLRNSMLCIALLVPPYLLIASLSDYGFLSISIISCVLVVSTIAFTYSKQKSSTLNKSVQPEEACLSSQILSEPQPQNGNFRQIQEGLAEYQTGNETVTQKKEVKGHGVTQNLCCSNSPEMMSYLCQILQKCTTIGGSGMCPSTFSKSPSNKAQNHVSYSECESLDGHSSSSEDSAIHWQFSSGEQGQSPHCSDCSISDEESLIEITLPNGHFLDSEKDPNLSFQQHEKVFADLAQESIFLQHSLVDYQLGDISNMNEEDNMIEIDISMGSIKCSEFEIQA